TQPPDNLYHAFLFLHLFFISFSSTPTVLRSLTIYRLPPLLSHPYSYSLLSVSHSFFALSSPSASHKKCLIQKSSGFILFLSHSHTLSLSLSLSHTHTHTHPHTQSCCEHS